MSQESVRARMPPGAAELIEALAHDDARPAGGSVAAVVAALAQGLLAAAADGSRAEWTEAGGARAQAQSLRRRALALAETNARAYAGARAALASRGESPVDEEEAARRDHLLGQAVALSADPPLAIAATAADVAELAALVAAHGAADVRPDAAVAAMLASAAARASSYLVEVNLVAGADEKRLRRARTAAEAAAAAAQRAIDA